MENRSMTTVDHGRASRLGVLSPRNASALYLLVVLIVIFSIWTPATFPRYATLTGILNDNVVAGILALSLVLPLAAREFDISVGYNLGTSSIVFAALLGSGSVPVWLAALITLAFGVCVGLFNAVLVVGIGLDSFIATLASGALLYAVTLALSGGVILVDGLTETTWIVGTSIRGISHPVLYMLALTAFLWIFLQHTVTGRRLLATGINVEAAELAGLKTRRLKFSALVASGVIASSAGIVVTAQVGAATPSTGPDYLIPAFAAVFLGSTQLWPGLVNSWGTLLAIILLGTIQNGLSLAGVPTSVPQFLTGAVLIAAIAITRLRANYATWVFRRRLRRRSEGEATEAAHEPVRLPG